MIQEIRSTPPFIDFGFGITETTIATGKPATVWLSTLYNQDDYIVLLAAFNGGTVTPVSNYQFKVSYTTPGTYQLQITVYTKAKNISLASNILTLIVT